MKGILVIFLLLSFIQLNAQTGIGTTTPHASAKLEVASDRQGFLPPRVSLTGINDVSTISSPATGLLVYCKGDAGLPAGYYYWNGSAWATIATAGGSGSFAAGFMRGSRTSNQTITVGGLVGFSSIDNSSGNDISLNTTTGKITLTAGNTYRLIASVPNFSGSRPSFTWYNETTGTNIGSAVNAFNPNDAAGNGAFGGIAEVIISPNVNTVVYLKLVSVGNSTSTGSISTFPNGDFLGGNGNPWFEAQVISGNAPVTGQSVDYISVQSSGQTVVTGNTIKFQNTLAGNIPYNSTTGNFTLTAGKTYRLTAYATLDVSSSAGAEIDFVWKNAAGDKIGNYAILFSENSNLNASGQGVADIIYTPSANTTVSVYVEYVAGTIALRGGYTNAIITQIGSSAIVNPWVLSGNDSYNITGNVGVGTNAPTSKLNIAGGGIKIASGLGNTSTRPALNTTSIGNYEIRGVGGGASQWDTQDDGFLRLSAGGGSNVITQSSIDISGYSTVPDMSNNIVMRTGGTERLRIDPSGNVNVTGKINVGDATGNVVTKVSGRVTAGTFLTLDNLKFSVTTSEPRGLAIATVSGTSNLYVQGIYVNGSGSISASRTASTVAYTTTTSGSPFSWSFGSAGDTIIYHFMDVDNGRMYRVTLVIMPSYINNFIAIERLL